MTDEADEAQEPPPVVYALRIGARAERDVIEATVRFSELSGDEVAREWQRGLFVVLAALADNPRRFPVAPESSRFSEEARQYVYRRTGSSVAYRLLYFVQDTGTDGPTVTLIHVRHGSARPISRAEARAIEAQNE
jgi:plasmid stabilization system protein ParE